MLIGAMVGCAIVAILLIIIAAWFIPRDAPVTAVHIETLCVNNIRVMLGQDGNFRQMVDQWGRGIGCEEGRD
jgi:hypothetical protein